ncbi:hypothetical protein BG454_00960 [Roseinatronobacter bogoriensis subsp. barguzinensis]|uniref:Uncharacterized protein n=1 Tax=Roseinatronobacter bogoriensis subsp. barguzinensis TaxID=441209 RepID=A0A2K8K563_9RHOB|nr:hypothetical protein BG454_00960 [Rhodobaca barguzinensis]
MESLALILRNLWLKTQTLGKLCQDFASLLEMKIIEKLSLVLAMSRWVYLILWTRGVLMRLK